MDFKKLRISNFKSFVDPVEININDGLTGVVGPNGCGKSNLVEALRWVMGETSYKSMRTDTMDDVIFSGTENRPARNFAEVSLFLDNKERSAPKDYNTEDNIEIIRRIERESGSAYKVNGKDIRARDIQMFFADVSTGARSPSLVRQGQIDELISQKPEQRRKILEEAAGISGFHVRRHEAELRLNAANNNIDRLDDVLKELSSQIRSLRKQAREAARYKSLSEEIRNAQAIVLAVKLELISEELEDSNKKFNEALKRYIGIFDSYPDFSYLVLEKLKITYEKLGTNENFFTFIKSLSSIRNPMELYSNLSNYIPKNMSNEDISELYNTEFQKGEASLTQLSDYLNLIVWHYNRVVH